MDIDPRALEVLHLKNITEAPFSHKFQGKTYSLAKNETVALPRVVAEHLAKHMVKQQFTQEFKKVPQNSGRAMPRVSDQAFRDRMSAALGSDVIGQADGTVPSEEQIIDNAVKQAGSMAGSSPKEAPANELKQKLDPMTKKQLLEYAKISGISNVNDRMNNDQIREQILKGSGLPGAIDGAPEQSGASESASGDDSGQGAGDGTDN